MDLDGFQNWGSHGSKTCRVWGLAKLVEMWIERERGGEEKTNEKETLLICIPARK